MGRRVGIAAALAGLERSWRAGEREQVRIESDTRRAFHSIVVPFLRSVSLRLQEREWHRGEWNVFDVLGRTRLEDAHTDALAWLFDPQQAHGMGTNALEAFLRKSWGRKLPNPEIIAVNPRRKLDAHSTIDIEVIGHGWWVAVENKVDDQERDSQTQRYAAHYQRLGGRIGKTVFPVFLTRQGERADSRRFKTMSYRELREVLETLASPTEAGRVILRQFIQHICFDLEVSE